MTTTLITGGNKGLGYTTAQRLIAEGHTVYIGARDEARGKTAAEELGARFVQLDVTSNESVDAAIASIGELDVLINNAGIVGPRSAVEELTAEEVRDLYETNVFGIVRMTRAALPLLRASAAPSIINVTSGLGFARFVNDPTRVESTFATVAYGSSKAAVIMLTVQYAKAMPDVRVNVADPGYTATDFNGHHGTQTVEEGTDAIVRLALEGADGPTGGFYDRDGLNAY